MKNNQDIKGILRRCWGQFCETVRSENRPELIERYEPDMKRFELGLFRIVVMGEIKKGKTSFINALLGTPDLLPVTSDIATSVVFKVIYGPERKFKVFFQTDTDTGKRPEQIEIAQEQLSDYGTESGNPGNKKRVDFIGVEEPNPMLAEGIVLIDTPGVGGLFKAHREISWRYAPNADAIFFVLDSVEAVMSRDEVNFLKELKNRLKKQVFSYRRRLMPSIRNNRNPGVNVTRRYWNVKSDFPRNASNTFRSAPSLKMQPMNHMTGLFWKKVAS